MLNNNLKELRKSKNLTQEEFGIKLNVVRQTISKWENGLSVPDSEMLVQISDMFEIPVSTLLGENVDFVKNQDNINTISERLSVINKILAKRAERKRLIIRVLSSVGFLFCLTLLISKIIEKLYYNSIGYIGGADGPTSIYLVPSNNNWLNILIFIVVLLFSSFGIYITRRNK
ncbi:MAG: helix-turn-helix domain-containing protein [Clostridia bacterium]